MAMVFITLKFVKDQRNYCHNIGKERKKEIIRYQELPNRQLIFKLLKDLDPWDLKKGPRFKLEWNAGETLVGPLPNDRDLGVAKDLSG
jgi:hypothetical protein